MKKVVFSPFSSIVTGTTTPAIKKSTVSKLGDNGRIIDPTILNTQILLGVRNSTDLVPTYTVTGSDVIISLPAHTRTVVGPSGPIVLSYGAMSANWAFSSSWTAYVSDPDLLGIPSPVVTLTNNINDLMFPDIYEVARGITPDSGGGGGSVDPGGGGGGRSYD